MTTREVLGIVLPDVLALIVLYLQVPHLAGLRAIMQDVAGSTDRETWSRANVAAGALDRKIFTAGFFVPGLLSLGFFLGLIVEGGCGSGVLLLMCLVLVLFAGDLFYSLSSGMRFGRVLVCHKIVATSLIVTCAAGKLCARVGW